MMAYVKEVILWTYDIFCQSFNLLGFNISFWQLIVFAFLIDVFALVLFRR